MNPEILRHDEGFPLKAVAVVRECIAGLDAADGNDGACGQI